jgi:hypothetical protein
VGFSFVIFEDPLQGALHNGRRLADAENGSLDGDKLANKVGTVVRHAKGSAVVDGDEKRFEIKNHVAS